MKNNIRRRFLSVILTLALAAILMPAITLVARADSAVWEGSTSVFTIGDGMSPGTAFEISTAEQLAYLAQHVNEATFYKLTEDIVLNDESFSFDPASGILTVTDSVNTGYLGTGIYGTTYHTETVSTAGTWYTAAALESDDLTTGSYGGTLNEWIPIGTDSDPFGGIFDGNGYTVSGVYINGDSNCQGLFGYIIGNRTSVKNVGVESSCIIGKDNVGGVVGYNDYGTAIRYCYNAGSVVGKQCVGGVTGNNGGGKVWYSYNTGAVTGSNSYSRYVGGVAGYCPGTLEYCYNTGSVTAAEVVGGVVGCNEDGTVRYSYNTGSVTGVNAIGGVAGANQNQSAIAMVQYCYNTGAVTGSGVYIGGVVGYNQSTVTYCYYDNQTCSALGIGSDTVSTDVENSAEGKQTSDMQGEAQKTGDSGDGWTTAHWAFESDSYPQHTGTTAATAFEISTAEQLTYLAQQVNGGTDFAGIYFRQTADINLNEDVTFAFDADTGLVEVSKLGETTYWLGTGAKGDASGENTTFDTAASTAGAIYNDSASAATGTETFALNSWTPIGSEEMSPFAGIFDGNGHTVNGVYINSIYQNRGLFGVLEENSTIENVHVANSYIKGGFGTGGVVAYNYLSTVRNCCNQGTVTGDNGVGGVVAYNYLGTVRNCCNQGAVTGAEFVGGVTGSNDQDSMVSNCYNTGAVTGDNSVGGVVGHNTGSTVQYSYNTGNVNGKFFAGGVAGYDDGGTIRYCYNTGAVMIRNDDEFPGSVGGVVGADDGGTIRYCYNAGSILDYTMGENGGVAGGYYNGSTVENCYYDNQIFPGGRIDLEGMPRAVGKLTSEMVGTGLSTLLGAAENWVFTADLYPRLSGIDSTTTPITDCDMESTNAAKLSASPVFFAVSEMAYTVASNFTVSTENGVAWSSLDESIISVTGAAATVTGTGEVYLKASITDGGSTISRTVNLYVPGTHTFVITGGSGSYNLYGSENGGDFNMIYTNVALGPILSYIHSNVVGGSATIWFGETGSDVSGDNAVAGTLDIGTDNVYLQLGTYTLKGKLSSNNGFSTLLLDGTSAVVGGASAVVDGATLTNTGYGSAIFNRGSGSVTVSGDPWDAGTGTGTYICSSTYCAIYSEGGGTLEISGGTVSAPSMTVGTSSGANVSISGGRIEAGDGCALCPWGGTCRITGGTITSASTQTDPSSWFCGTVYNCDYEGVDSILYISGGTIENTASGYPAIYNYFSDSGGTAEVHLSGTPSISGTADIWTNVPIFANDGEASPAYYSGTALDVEYGGGTITAGETVAVSGVVGNSSKFTCANTGYEFSLSDTDLVISEPATNNNPGGSYITSTPSKTITVTETSSELFKDSGGVIKAEANVNNAFSSSVEVKVTDTEADTSGFRLGAGNKVYPFDISLYIKGTDTKTEPNDGYSVTISLPIPDELLDVKDQLTIAHKSDDGTVTTLHSQLKQINGVWYLVFEASEFSPYALVVNDLGTYDKTAGLPYYVDASGNETFIGFAAGGKCIAPEGVTVLVKQNAKSFSDISSHWAKSNIDFVTGRELFTGIGSDTFSPNTGMTRAMFATVIGRLYERSFGEIKNTGTHSFTDCDYGDYYGKYVDWAAEEGVIGGYGNGEFGPNDPISREQMAAILYRFADFLGVLPADTGAALAYPDAGDISSWAQNAALYCQSTGIITGRDGGSFAPQGTATRAEVAVILERFIENVLD